MTYHDGVYDLTKFAKSHPGGSSKLLMAKGGPIEPFWEMYPFHKEENIVNLLAEYRIGTLEADEVLAADQLPDFKEMQTQNLQRSKEQPLLQQFPYCAQTPSSNLVWSRENWLTNASQMFERNHNLVPEIDPDEYELLLNLLDKPSEEDSISMTLSDLKEMESVSVQTVISCAGNKRLPLQKEFPNVKGLKWTNGAVANLEYKGVLVRDILLKNLGYKEEDLVGRGLHLVTSGYDSDF